jgi:Na+-translocating ferredoxin:NAD+ oxidoreductase RnfE subunit
VLETLSIGPGRAVSLVQLGSVRAVVGTDGSGIKTIVLAPPAFEEQLSEFDDDSPSIQTTGDAA